VECANAMRVEEVVNLAKTKRQNCGARCARRRNGDVRWGVD
jgi:hypothetical protein